MTDVHRSLTIRDGAAPRDAGAHLFMRCALLKLLVHDKRVLACFETFAGGEVFRAVSLVAGAGELVAQACGWRDRAHMYADPARHDDVLQASAQGVVYRELLDTFPWARVSADFPAVAAHMVYETWDLPRQHPRERWDWLCDDLLLLYLLSLQGFIEGRQMFVTATTEHAMPVAVPEVTLSFTASPSETSLQALRRMKALYDEAQALLGPDSPSRRGADLDDARLTRDVTWFYRRVLKHPRDNESAVAREYHATMHAGQHTASDHRSTVRQAVTRARRLLAETSI